MFSGSGFALDNYPVSVTSPVPGDGIQGSNTAFTSTTDANAQTSTMEYNDPLLRPTKAIAPNGHQTITEYGAGIDQNSRWVKVKRQIDDYNWEEATNIYDGIGRTYKIKSKDTNGDVITEKQYNNMGRVWKVSNPYRINSSGNPNETVYWTENTYDDLGRAIKVKTPDNAEGNSAYSLAIIGNQIGTAATVTDQAGKLR